MPRRTSSASSRALVTTTSLLARGERLTERGMHPLERRDVLAERPLGQPLETRHRRADDLGGIGGPRRCPGTGAVMSAR